MIKKIFAAVILLVLVFTTGCNNLPTQSTTPSTSSTIVKSQELASDWRLSQMRLELKSGDEMSLLLKLTPGDKADGYFYLEKGRNVKFKIMGISQIYESKVQEAYGQITSDRFEFIANEAQGNTYTLTFKNNTDSAATLFLELIYPITGSVYTPVETE